MRWGWRRWFAGLVDELAMRLVDIKSSLPLILIALILVITLGQSFPSLWRCWITLSQLQHYSTLSTGLIGPVRSIAQSWHGPTKVG